MTDHVVVCGCVVERAGEYLLVQEGKERVRGQWNLPAGRLDAGEHPPDAASREVREETGLSVRPDYMVGTYVGDGETVDVRVAMVYGASVDADATAAPQDDDDVVDVAWVEPGDLRGRDDLRSPYVYAAVSDHMSGERHPRDLAMTS